MTQENSKSTKTATTVITVKAQNQYNKHLNDA